MILIQNRPEHDPTKSQAYQWRYKIMTTQPAQLQRGVLGLLDVVFQGITHIAPAISVVFTLPVVAFISARCTWPGTPFTVLKWPVTNSQPW